MTRYEMFYDAVLSVSYWASIADEGSPFQGAIYGLVDAYLAVLDATPRSERVLR